MRIAMFLTLLSGCVSLSGLKPTAAQDMSCDAGDLSTSVIRQGYSPDDFGARVEVTGCGNRAEYEKKGPNEWALVSEIEPVGSDDDSSSKEDSNEEE